MKNKVNIRIDRRVDDGQLFITLNSNEILNMVIAANEVAIILDEKLPDPLRVGNPVVVWQDAA